MQNVKALTVAVEMTPLFAKGAVGFSDRERDNNSNMFNNKNSVIARSGVRDALLWEHEQKPRVQGLSPLKLSTLSNRIKRKLTKMSPLTSALNMTEQNSSTISHLMQQQQQQQQKLQVQMNNQKHPMTTNTTTNHFNNQHQQPCNSDSKPVMAFEGVSSLLETIMSGARTDGSNSAHNNTMNDAAISSNSTPSLTSSLTSPFATTTSSSLSLDTLKDESFLQCQPTGLVFNSLFGEKSLPVLDHHQEIYLNQDGDLIKFEEPDEDYNEYSPQDPFLFSSSSPSSSSDDDAMQCDIGSHSHSEMYDLHSLIKTNEKSHEHVPDNMLRDILDSLGIDDNHKKASQTQAEGNLQESINDSPLLTSSRPQRTRSLTSKMSDFLMSKTATASSSSTTNNNKSSNSKANATSSTESTPLASSNSPDGAMAVASEVSHSSESNSIKTIAPDIKLPVKQRRKRVAKQPTGIDAELSKLLSEDDFKLPPSEWQAKIKQLCLTEEQYTRAKKLRRKSLSCVYANRCREKQTVEQLKTVQDKRDLEIENKRLREENEDLRGQMKQLKLLLVSNARD